MEDLGTPSQPEKALEIFSRALLVEDEPAHARLINRALRVTIASVEHALKGADALKLQANSPADIVFVDLNLPDMTGFELLNALKATDSNLPIVIMTSSSNLDTAVRAMREGAWDYVVKEFGESFDERVKLVLARVGEKKVQLMREQKLRAERDAFWAAVRTAQDGVAVLDEAGNIVFGNDTFVSLTRSISGVETNDSFLTALASRDKEAAAVLDTQLRATAVDALWRTELRFENTDNKEPRFFELTLTSYQLGERLPATDSQIGSAARHHVLWIKDITVKKLQEKFQRDLLATTSHDLKGPLGAILNCAELLDGVAPENGDNSRTRDLITRIGSCARGCISLIDELLSARRIQDGVLVIKPDWHNLDEIIEDTVLDYQPMAKAKNIELSWQIPEPELQIYADKLALVRVLGNLINNAIKFTPKQGTIRVTAKKGETTVAVIVEDSGCGIESEAIPTLFEKYTRLDKHQAIAGTGLGLFVAKSIVTAHGGNIEVQSRVGEGTTFNVMFPLP